LIGARGVVRELFSGQFLCERANPSSQPSAQADAAPISPSNSRFPHPQPPSHASGSNPHPSKPPRPASHAAPSPRWCRAFEARVDTWDARELAECLSATRQTWIWRQWWLSR